MVLGTGLVKTKFLLLIWTSTNVGVISS